MGEKERWPENFLTYVYVCTGCQLNDKNRTYTFDVPEEWSYEQQLALRTVRDLLDFSGKDR